MMGSPRATERNAFPIVRHQLYGMDEVYRHVSLFSKVENLGDGAEGEVSIVYCI